MDEERLFVGDLWENSSNIEADVNSINWNIKNNRGKKIVVDLPISYFDENIFNSIVDIEAIEFESRDGRRYKPKDILLTNNKLKNMINDTSNSDLSQFEKFIAIYSFVTNYKPYKTSDEKYYDIGRSPYLFLDDDYINCVGICQLLCILSRQVGINITMFADEDKEHAICYFYLRDDKYGIDGYFSTNPTDDSISEEKAKGDYCNMIQRITINNGFEKFLNSNRQLSYPNDIADINIFSKHVSFLKTCRSFVEPSERPIELLYSFRDEFQTKNNHIGYNTICSAVLSVEHSGYGASSNEDEKDMLKNMLFLKELKEKSIVGEDVENLIESFVDSTINKRKQYK